MTPRANRLHVALYVVALLLGCACVVGGVLSVRAHAERSDAAESAADQGVEPPSRTVEERYGEVKEAAESTAKALVNIDYRDPQASVDAIGKTATGRFLKQYTASTDGLVQLVKTYRAVLTGKVSGSAVSDVDDDSATVLVATSGEIKNSSTGSEPQARNFRLLVKLVQTDDGWRTNDLEFVG